MSATVVSIRGPNNEPLDERAPEPPADELGGGGPPGGSPGAIDDGCPVTPLGHLAGTFYYLSPSGQLRGLGEREHSGLGMIGLFEGQTEWLQKKFPRYAKPKDGGKPEIIGWSHGQAASEMMRRCGEAGFFNPDTQLRGPGAWALPDGELLLHCGDALVEFSEPAPHGIVSEAGRRIGNKVYAARAPEPRPADHPAAAADARALHELFCRWKWRAPLEAPRLLLGWVALAYLCGVFDWRSHIWVIGDKGVGKTTLQDLVFGLLGDSLWKVSDPSAAGLRQALNGAARPVAIDEIEASANSNRSRDVVELMRLASSDRQGRVLRGSAEGKATSYTVKAAIYCTSVLHPTFLPQDISRITVLELDALEKDAKAMRSVRAEVRKMIALGTGFRARMARAYVDGRLQQNLMAYEEALAAKSFTSRMIDQFGTLLACAETLLSDHEASADEVRDFMADFQTEEFLDRGEDEDHELCRNHLFSSAVDIWDDGRRVTVGQLLHEHLGGGSSDRVAKVLMACGLRCETADEAGQCLVVANRHQGLERVFANTRWAGGVWAQSLRRVPGAFKGEVMVFAGARARTTWIPTQRLRNGEDEGASPPLTPFSDK